MIEDDKEFRGTLIKALKKEGYLVDSAEKGEEAIKLAKKNKFGRRGQDTLKGRN